MNGQSVTVKEEKIRALKQAFPEVFTEEKIDFDKLKQMLGEEIETDIERYGLNWAGKSGCFEELQTPTTATLRPDPKQSVDFDASKNLFIEGDNLEVLKVLQKSYYKKVKMIYIDPPYNTGNDFIYHDRFKSTQDEYLKASGERDEEGNARKSFRKNSKENGHYHSDWLNMMYPRLFLAKNLLREDGVIFVSIDDNEVHNLRLMMNEIFGEENFVGEFVWQNLDTVKNDAKYISKNHEYILCYAKSLESLVILGVKKTDKQRAYYKNLDEDLRGDYLLTPLNAKSGTEQGIYEYEFRNGYKYRPPQGTFPRFSKETLKKLEEDNRIYFSSKGGVPQKKTFWNEVSDRMKLTTFWEYEFAGSTRQSNKELADILGKGMFDNPKPTSLLKIFLDAFTQKDDITLDFFAGSGTTAQAVMELNGEDGGNRKFILVQLPEVVSEDSEAFKAGYKTIADIARERIRRVIAKIGSGDFRAFKLAPSNFKIWRGDDIPDEETLLARIQDSINTVKPSSEKYDMLYELLLKQGIEPTAEREDKGDYYKVGDTIVCFAEPMKQEIITKIIAEKPQIAIFIDRSFHDQDQLKTNTSLQMRDNGIEFKVI